MIVLPSKTNFLAYFSLQVCANLPKVKQKRPTFLEAHNSKTSVVRELRQYKNGFVSVKRMFVLKLPPFSPCRVGEE